MISLWLRLTVRLFAQNTLRVLLSEYYCGVAAIHGDAVAAFGSSPAAVAGLWVLSSCGCVYKQRNKQTYLQRVSPQLISGCYYKIQSIAYIYIYIYICIYIGDFIPWRSQTRSVSRAWGSSSTTA